MEVQKRNAVRIRHPRRSIAPEGSSPLEGAIGNTPLLMLRHVTAHLPPSVSISAKAEFMNPGGSVKARAALRMVEEGFSSGAMGPGKTLVDATSGNTGIAYAMLGAAMGFPVKLAMPASASASRLQIVRALGAELVLTDPQELTDGAQRYVQELVGREPDRYFYPDQYNNDANWMAHFDTTAVEILAQAGDDLTHFVASLGTTGTFTGVSRRLRRDRPEVRCVAVQPDSPLHGIEGVKHLATAIVPGIFAGAHVDEELFVSTDEALAMTRRLATEEGLLVGISSGANVAASLRIAERLEFGKVVTVLCDDGTHYLGEPIWEETETVRGMNDAHL